MAWNYRDYGRSEGTPDPFLCLHDSESILKFLIKDLGLIGKIGCFGRSLGGTMASHLANNFGEHIDFLFVDRSLGSLQAISQRLILGSYNQSLFNMLTQGWCINNAKNFYEAKCFKMLTQDPKDDTIDQFSALNAQVASFACEEEIGETRYSSLKIEKSYNAFRMLFMVENKLFILLKHQSKHIKKNQKAKR
jgi:pimeloyl-ACP methyl ester carboxylesterase